MRLRGVALLAPHAQVLPEPSLDRLGVGLHHRRRRPAARRRRPGGQVPRRDVLPHRRARDAGRGGYAADRLAPPGPPPDILYLVHADHFLSGPPNVEIGSHRQLSVQGGGRRGPYHFGKFSFTGMESGLYHFRKSDVTKYTTSCPPRWRCRARAPPVRARPARRSARGPRTCTPSAATCRPGRSGRLSAAARRRAA